LPIYYYLITNHQKTTTLNLSKTLFLLEFTTTMKSVILFALICLSTSVASAHEYFFAFAEVSYNQKDSILEATVIASAHETEDALNTVGITIRELEEHYKDSVMIKKLEHFINQGFSMQFGENTAQFTLIGFEVDKRGMVQFYLTSQKLTLTNDYTVSFGMLMDQFPDQQNKLIFKAKGKDYTAVFLPQKRSQNLSL